MPNHTSHDIGIRRETKAGERRVPLIPAHVAELVRDHGLRVAVQSSPTRCHPDQAYRDAGADVADTLPPCRVILGVKEIPVDEMQAGSGHLCFSHTIKGQDYNMPMLRGTLHKGATLIDYELIVDRHGRRLIFFGRHAGYAGMVDTLWAFGQRLLSEGIDTSLAPVKRAFEYDSVDDATDHLATVVADRIRTRGVVSEIHPLVVGFTGGGNVSQGAQEILERLPVVEVSPEELPALASNKDISRRAVYKVVFRRDDRRDFARHLPFLSILVNGIYWEPGSPKLMTRADMQALWSGGAPKLKVVGDITCDIDGSVECNLRATTPDNPVYVYHPATHTATDGVAGHGPVVMAVDNLPAEFPLDASAHFGDSLFPFVAPLARADFGVSFEHLALPAAVTGAVIAHGGELAPGFRHLEEAMVKAGA